MTDDDYDALSQKQLASIKRDMRISLEDAAVRATHKVMAEEETSAQRTWVGLTYEDMVALQKDLFDAKGESVLPTTFAMAVEAKLKEKNT